MLGETFVLEWSHVDFKMNVIFVNQRIYKGVLDTPKTSSSRVSVIMLEPLEKVIKNEVLKPAPLDGLFQAFEKRDVLKIPKHGTAMHSNRSAESTACRSRAISSGTSAYSS